MSDNPRRIIARCEFCGGVKLWFQYHQWGRGVNNGPNGQPMCKKCDKRGQKIGICSKCGTNSPIFYDLKRKKYFCQRCYLINYFGGKEEEVRKVKKVTIEFETVNDAFMPDWEYEASKIFIELSQAIYYKPHIIKDANGNKVGTISYDYEEEEV